MNTPPTALRMSEAGPKPRRFGLVLGLFAFAFTLRLAYWAYAGTSVGLDTGSYLSTCSGWVDDPIGTARSRVGFEYAGFTLPFCAFFALPGATPAGWIMLQILLSAGSVVLLYEAGRLLWGGRVGLGAALSYAVAWEAFQWDAYLLSDSLFLFTICLTLWTFARQLRGPTPGRRRAAWASVSWLALSRPVGIPLLLAWVIFDAWGRPKGTRIQLFKNARTAVTFSATLILVVAFLSSRSNWAGTDLYPVWSTGTLVWDDPRFTYPFAIRPADDWLGLALRNVDHLLAMAGLKVLLILLPFVPRFSLAHNAMNLLTLLPTVFLAAAGVRRLARENARLAGLLVMPLLMLGAILAVTFIDYDWRYRAPLVPLLAVLAGYEVGRNPVLAGRISLWKASLVDDASPAPATVEGNPGPARAFSMRTQVVMPAFNEERTIGSLVHLCRKSVDQVVVVDDGSSDRTAEVARLAGARVIRLETNQGKGRALQTGFEVAREANAEVIVTLDADGQHDPEEIPALVAPIDNGTADLVIGSRRLTNGQRRRIPRFRRVGQFLFTRAASAATASRVTDSESGYRAYRASMAAGFRWMEDGYGTEWETLQQARASGARIIEVPIGVTYLPPNPTHVGTFSHALSVGASILRFVRSEHPMLFLGVPGAALLAIGFLLGLQTATHYYGTGEFWPGKAMLSMLALILGAVALLGGLVLDAVALMLRRSGRPPSPPPPPS